MGTFTLLFHKRLLSLKRKRRETQIIMKQRINLSKLVAGFGISLKGPRVIDTEEKDRGVKEREIRATKELLSAPPKGT